MTIKPNFLATAAACFLAITTSSAAHADNYRHHVNERQHHQQQRLSQGRRSGELTGVEYARLRERESHLALREARMRNSGGGLSRKEAGRLNRQQNELSESIYNQKHDGQERH